jgi:single-strand DNA-binding protein
MNVFTFTGNLGKDAEMRHTANNDAIVSFSVAVKSGFGKNEKTAWVKCNLWGKRGEAIVDYLKKGTQVGVSGEFGMSEWTDKDGNKRTDPEVRVNDVTLLGGKPSQGQAPNKSQTGGLAEMEDSIPF